MRPRICQFVVLLALSYLSCSHGLTNPSRKNWWAKRVASDDFYTCGRPTERQIKYASETGFKTLISLHTYDSDMGNVTAPGGIYLPSTARTRYIAEQIAGMDFRVVLPSGVRNWMSLDVISRIHAIIRQSTKPLLFYCASSYGATFLTLAHFLNVSTHNDNLAGETKLTDSELFSVGAQLGFDFINNTTLRRLVSEIVGRNKVSEPLAPEVIIKSWQIKYWQMKPVYKHIFVAGQIQSNELEAIRSAGIKTIINNRKGTTIPPKDEKSQEEVGLLNVKDMTGTYSGTGRQRTEQLEANRIDPYKPTIYISDTSTLNYEMNNTLEFGDDIGYNETMERMAIENMLPGVEYIHLPINGRYKYGRTLWEQYKDTVWEAARKGPVLMHCNSGFRSVALAVMVEAYLYCFNSTWARDRASEIGYDLGTNKLAVRMLRDVLDLRTSCVPEDGFHSVDITSSASAVRVASIWISIISLSFLSRMSLF